MCQASVANGNVIMLSGIIASGTSLLVLLGCLTQPWCVRPIIPVSESQTRLPSSTSHQEIGRESSSGTIYRGNLQRTGVYKGRGVPHLNNAEVLTPRIFKTETSKVKYWSEWFDVGGYTLFASTEQEVSTGRISPPVFADNTLYFKVDDYTRPESVIYAVSSKTGQLNWNLRVTKGIASLPTFNNGSLYLGAGSGLFYALDPLAKKVKWSSSSRDNSFVMTSPLIAGGSVFFGSTNGIFYSLDEQTGKTRWEFDTDGQGMGEAPAFFNDTVYFYTDEGGIYALEAGTGRKKWELQDKDGVISLAVDDDTVYYRDGKGRIRSVIAGTGKPSSDSKIGERAGTHLTIYNKTIYFGKLGKWAVLAVDAATHRKRWEFDTGGTCSSPVIADRMLYVTCSDKKLYALDVETGGMAWVTKAYKTSLSAPVVAGGVIYFVSDDGYLHAVR